MSLKGLRLNRGLSVRELAKRAEVNPASVYYWERTGTRPRDAAAAKRVAAVFGLQVTDIWPVEQPDSPSEPKAA